MERMGEALWPTERLSAAEVTVDQRAMKDPPFERWKQPICDAIMRRIKCRQGIIAAEIIDEIGARLRHATAGFLND
jgi:hypothetical protein